MKKASLIALALFSLCAISTVAFAAPINLAITPERAEVALTIKPFEIYLSDNFNGSINLDTGERSFKHDLDLGGRLYLGTRAKLDTYFFGTIGLDQLSGENESQEFKLGLGKQYNFDDTFAVFGEFGAKVVKTGQVINITHDTNSLGLKFSF